MLGLVGITTLAIDLCSILPNKNRFLCRATLIMSPCGDIRNVPFGDVTTIEMSPNLEVSTGGQIGKDGDEL